MKNSALFLATLLYSIPEKKVAYYQVIVNKRCNKLCVKEINIIGLLVI